MKNEFMKRAIELSIESVNKNGGPFGSVIAKGNKIIAEGSNKVTFSNDPTAHGEIVAIREACKKLKNFNVEIFKEGKNNENVVNKSKTTGEPPLMNAMSVFFAIKDAISSVGNYDITPTINAPATPEKILMSINNLKAKL